MSAWVVFAPCPRVDRLPYNFVATSARRGDDGLLAEVQVLNGTPKWGNQVLIANAGDRATSATAIAACTNLAEIDAGAALLELHALVEDAIRVQSAPQDWPAPLPLNAIRVYSVFPVGVLPRWMRAYVEAVSEFNQTPIDLAAMLGLAMLALSCQRFAILEMKPGYREPLCLYILVAMESGERKSSVFRAMGSPVYAYEKELRERWGPAIASLQAERRILEKGLDKAVQEAAGKDATKHEIDAAKGLAQELQKAAVPVEPVLVIQDSTPESMIQELAAQGGCLAALDTEGGLLDTLMGARYSDNGPNLDPLLKAHAGDEIRSARVSRGRISIESPMLTIGIAPQPDVVQGLASKPGAKKRGLLARFLYSLPTSRKGTRQQGAHAVPLATSDVYCRYIRALLAFGEPITPGATFERSVVKPSTAALELWDTFSSWLEPQLPRDAALGNTNGWAEKLAGEVGRIATLFHLADGRDPQEQARYPLSIDAMQRATHLGEVYLLPHALAALRTMGADPALEDAYAILAWIERNGREMFSLRDVCDDLRYRFGRPDEVKPGIAVLVEHFYIRPIDEVRTGPGRKPTQRYQVNPQEPTENTGITRNRGARSNSPYIPYFPYGSWPEEGAAEDPSPVQDPYGEYGDYAKYSERGGDESGW